MMGSLLMAQGPPPPPDDPGGGSGGGGGTLPPNPSTGVSQTHYCGYTELKATGTPPLGYAWYWQTSRSGTSRSHLASNNGKYNATSKTTYYIRTYYAPSGTWSDEYESQRVQVNSGFKVSPSQPAVSIEKHCGSTTLVGINRPAGVTWYWQSTSSSKDMNNSSNAISKTTGTRTYIRARHNTSGCWSATKTVNYTVDQIPEYPPRPTEINNGGNTLLTAATPSDPNTYFYWQQTENGTSKSNNDKYYTVYEGQRVWLRAYNRLSDCWSGTRVVDYSIIYNPAPPKYITIFECNKTTYKMDLDELAARENEEWFWQTDEDGMGQDDDATQKVITSIEGKPNFYLRARVKDTNIWSHTTVISPFVKQTPHNPIGNDIYGACWGDDVTFSASHSGEELRWYTEELGGVLKYTGNDYLVTDLKKDVTYWVESETNGCISSRVSISASVRKNTRTPQFGEINPDKVCGAYQLINGDTLGAGSPYYFLGKTPNPSQAELFQNHLIETSGMYYFAIGITSSEGVCLSEPIGYNLVVGSALITPETELSTNVCGPKTLKIKNYPGQAVSWPYGQPTFIEVDENDYSVYRLSNSGNYNFRISKTYGCESSKIISEHGYVYVTLVPSNLRIGGGGFFTDYPDSYRQVKLYSSEPDVEYDIYDKNSSEVVLLETISGTGNIKSSILENGVYSVGARRQIAGGAEGEYCSTSFGNKIYVHQADIEFVNRSFVGTKSYLSPEKEDDFVHESNVIETITYMDDKGRPIQSIIADATPDGDKDIIQHIEYDELGRQEKKYLPFAADYGKVYHDKSQARNDQSNFYSTEPDVAHDTRPYSTISYDGSPFNQVTSVTGVGQDWVDNYRSGFRERLNVTSDDAVIHWEIVNGELTNMGFYTTGLIKNVYHSEDNQTAISFVNKSGQLILQRVEAPAEDGGWADTYNVYDDFGNVKFVLPPLALEEFREDDFGVPTGPDGYYLVTSDVNYENIVAESGGKIAFSETSSVTINEGTTLDAGTEILSYDYEQAAAQPNQSFLTDQIFQYEYDHRHRLIAKRVPESDWVYIVYDARDRVVLTQTANQRIKSKWSFVKYDVFNRAIITGEKVIDGDVESIRAAVASSNGTESYDASGLVQYTNTAYPVGIEVEDILSVTYYDDYAFTSETFQLPTGVFDDTDYKIIPAQSTFGVKGLTTGTLAKISGTTDQFVSVAMFYDDKYRLAQTVTQNHKGGTDRMTPQYNWRGLLMKTFVEHQSPDTSQGVVTITQVYTYDRMGRHLTTTHQIGSGAVQNILENRYNALGQLINKTIADGFEEIDYAYNIRGQITQMNDPNDNEDHMFEMEFKYQNATHAKFDGTIGEVVWKNPFESSTNGFDYQYDEMNRISSATGIGEAAANDLSDISYDLNGNIKALQRKGTHEYAPSQTIDDLVYSYDDNTNHLTGVRDASGLSSGFEDGNTEGDDYAYDANGNLIEDKNKGITAIEYNHLNQPTKVIYDANKYMEYTYAGASKVSQRLVDGSIEKVTDYIGGFVYENDTLQFMTHDQGRVVAQTDISGSFDGFEYQYHLTDHLGNVRVTFKTAIDVDDYLATAEDAESATEAEYFEKYDEVTRIKSALFDHTTDSTGYAVWLDGSADKQVGLAKSLMVKPGDVIDMEVFAKYYKQDNAASWTALLNTVASEISGGAPGVVYEAAHAASGLPFVDFLSGYRDTGEAPEAYLNYFVFDENYQLIVDKTGFQQISTAAEENGTDVAHEQLSHQITIEKVGYVYIYLSNESPTPVDVFFDDFTVTQTHSPVVQKDDYYPFGLSFNSYSRVAITDQNFKFNAGSELEEMTDWYSTPFRKYDPSLGRFHGVDALASMYSSWSPSQFAGNNPINYNDPTGLHQDDPSGEDSAPGNTSLGWGHRASIFDDHWSYGMENSDWSLHHGSASFRRAKKKAGPGSSVIGGKIYGWGTVEVGGYEFKKWGEMPSTDEDVSFDLFDFEIVLTGDGRMGEAVFGLASKPGKKTILIDVDGVFGMERGFFKDFKNKVDDLTRNADNKEFWVDLFADLVGSVTGTYLETNPNPSDPVVSSEEAQEKVIESTIETKKIFIMRQKSFSVPSMNNYTDSVFRMSNDSVNFKEKWTDAGGTWHRIND